MPSSSLLSTLLLLLVGAATARLTSRRLRRWAVPAIVLELLAGFVLGNTLLPSSRIQPLAGITELGVLTLFFQVALEVRGGLLGERPHTVVRLVALSALTPLLAWWPLQALFQLPTATTLLCLAVLSATGSGVTLRALAECRALATPSGRMLVGVSVLGGVSARRSAVDRPAHGSHPAGGNPIRPCSAAPRPPGADGHGGQLPAEPLVAA